jgi:hypothetical protein
MISTINLEDCELSVRQTLEILALKGSNIVIYKNGKPCYFFGEIDDFEEEVLSLSHNQDFINYLAECRQHNQAGQKISFAEVQKKLMELDS